MKEKNKAITILKPSEPVRKLPVNSTYHNSKWKPEKPFSGLDENHFTMSEQSLIHELIAADQWIEEESQDLNGLLAFNNCLQHFCHK